MWPSASSSAVLNGAAGMVIAAITVAALYEGRELLIPLALAGILSFILAPLVRRLANWGLPRGAAVGLVIALLLGLLLGGAAVAGRQVTQLLEELPRHEMNLRNKARYVHNAFGDSGIWRRAAATVAAIEEEVRDPQDNGQPIKIEVAQDSTLSRLFEYTRSSVPSVATAALALLFTIFILLQLDDLRDRALRLMGAAEIGRSTQALNEAGDDLAHFFLLQAGLNAGFGVFIGVALWMIGVPSPALWGAIAALMRFVPYVGSILSAIPPMALAAMVDPGWGMLIETAAVFLIGEPLVGQIIEPLLFGSQTRLSSVAVLFGATFWTLLWGPIGLVLAMPLTLAIVVMGQHIPRLDFLRILLGNEPALEPQEQLYHLLLAGEANHAAKAADRWIGERAFQPYLDEVAIPSFGIASDDHRRGVLGREPMNELKETVAEYVELMKESLDFDSEPQTEHGPNPTRSAANVLVMAGRGFLDLAVAELVAEAIRLDLGIPARCLSFTGLTAISSAAESADKQPDIIALVSVGAVTSSQLGLLVRRANRTFPRSQLVVGYWDRRDEHPQRAANVHYAECASVLIELIARLVDERPHTAASPLRLEVAGA